MRNSGIKKRPGDEWGDDEERFAVGLIMKWTPGDGGHR